MYEGDKVSIYQRPYTGEEYEGEAILLKKAQTESSVSPDILSPLDLSYAELQEWCVKFVDDDFITNRDILVTIRNKQFVPVYRKESEND